MKKDCAICEKSVEVKYTRYGFKSTSLFCIAAPPCLTVSSVNINSVDKNRYRYREELYKYCRYPEVSGRAPCFLYKETTSKSKLKKYEEKLKEIEKVEKEEKAEKKKAIAKAKREREAAKRRNEKAKLERVKKKERAIAQKKYREKKKAEKKAGEARLEAIKIEKNKYNRFEILDFEK
jgi:hypothetical protein